MLKVIIAAADVPRGKQAVVRYEDGQQMTSILGPLEEDRLISSPDPVTVEVLPIPGVDPDAVTDGELLDKLIEVSGYSRYQLEAAVRAGREPSGSAGP